MKKECDRKSTKVTIPKGKGPTIQLDYVTGCSANTINKFMYFIPLISPVLVDSSTSLGNTQTASITSYRTNRRKTCFRAVCKFEISGTGYLIYKYDPASTIAKYSKNKRCKKLKNVIDYIKVQGPGKGSVEVIGKIIDKKEVVNEVKIIFEESPKGLLCIGLYDIDLVGNKYDHASRYNQTVARVNTLTFKRTSGTANMEMKVSSVRKAHEHAGLLSGLMGVVANTIMKAPEIDEKGNQAILDFGSALLNKKQHFTFPGANNLMNDYEDHIPSYGKDELYEGVHGNSSGDSGCTLGNS